MKCIKRTLFCIGILGAFIILPFEFPIRYIIQGKDCFEKTFANRLMEYAINRE